MHLSTIHGWTQYRAAGILPVNPIVLVSIWSRVAPHEKGSVMGYLKVLLTLAAVSLCAVPQFHEPFKVQANGADLVVGLIAEPFMVDWDGDSLNDLIVGQFTSGKVSFFKNIGSNAEPVFAAGAYLQADGADITCSYG